MKIKLSQLKSIIREEVSRAISSLSEAEFSKSPHWSGEYGNIHMPENIRKVADSLKVYVDDLLMNAISDSKVEATIRINLTEIFKELLKTGPKSPDAEKTISLFREAKSLAMKALQYIDENLEELSERLEMGGDREKVVEDIVFQVFARKSNVT